MDEDLAIIEEKTRKEQIKGFLIKNKKIIYSFLALLLISFFSFFFYLDHIESKKIEIANKFSIISENYDPRDKKPYYKKMTEIIESYDSTYSPLALFFLIDNQMINSKEEANILFDQILKNTSLEKEIKNLMIYKKTLINADYQPEDKIVDSLKPLINSKSIWKPHSLLLLGDYFLAKGEKQKAKDFYYQILNSNKTNEDIFNQAQLKILRHFSD
tara:strand:+ start:200 stop:844 length:645 start_codon:yes stop_codon:yes gene_type:complete